MGGEDLRVGDASEVAPVGAVRGHGRAGVVVLEVFPGEEGGAVGEDSIAGGEALLGGGEGGDEEDGAGAEAEDEDWAVGAGDGGESAVEEALLGEEMEVADERKRWRGQGELRWWCMFVVLG